MPLKCCSSVKHCASCGGFGVDRLNAPAWMASPMGRPAGAAAKGTVTLLYSARDREHKNAVLLRDHLLAHLRKG